MSTRWPRPVVSRAISAASTPCAANMPVDDVGDRDAEPIRRAVRSAGDAHQAAFGLHHGVVARFVASRSRSGRILRSSSRPGADALAPSGSYPSPSCSIVPGRKFSTSTSARASRRVETSRAPACLKSSVRLSLLRLMLRKYALSPATNGGPHAARVVAAAGLLDLDDPRAHIGELHRAVRARQHAREVDYHQTVEWAHGCASQALLRAPTSNRDEIAEQRVGGLLEPAAQLTDGDLTQDIGLKY